jgi:hypothetical protein
MNQLYSKLCFTVFLGLTIISFPLAHELVYSTFLEGMSYDEGIAIAVDTAGNAYVVGWTSSNNFPVTPGAYDTTFHFDDIFVTKFTPDGSSLLYSTRIGSSGDDVPSGIVVDAAGNVYIAGRTDSPNYPVTTNAFDTSFNSPDYYDAFVTKLNSTGTALIYSTFLGSSGTDKASDIAIDDGGNAYVTGMTNSSSFPTTPGAYDTSYNGYWASNSNVYVTKLNADGSALIYSTFIGGMNHDEGYAIALDDSENAYITGVTDSIDYPTTPGAYKTNLGGYNDGFVTKLNANGSALVYSTYLGGRDDDDGIGIAVDGSGNAYVTGLTYSDNFPTTAGALSRIFNRDTTITAYDDAFVTKLNSSGTALVYSTYLGGNEIDFGSDIAVNTLGHAYVIGQTRSWNFPVTHSGYDQSYNGDYYASVYAGDVFVTRLNVTGSALVYSTFLGGNRTDSGSGIALDNDGNAYITGYTQSSTFPVTPGAFDTTFYIIYYATHAFVSKLVIDNSPLAVEDEIWKSYIDLSIIDSRKR